MKIKVGIVGAGVIGLTNAVYLLENGCDDVTLISKSEPLATNSDTAVATWYAPDGSKPMLQKLCFETLLRFESLSRMQNSGICFIPIAYYFKDKDEYYESGLYQAIKQGFIAIREDYVPPAHEAYPIVVVANIPLADVPIYRPYLLSQFKQLGGKLRKQEITALDDMATEYDVVINCAGWEAKRLAKDSLVFPARGQTEVATFPQTATLPLSINVAALDAYVVFRPMSNDCVIGTTYQINNISTRPSEEDRLSLIKKVAPLFPDAVNLTTRSVVGIRCGRTDVRLDQEIIPRESDRPCLLIHCYGHGGSGFSGSWGSARYVLEHVMEHCKKNYNQLRARL